MKMLQVYTDFVEDIEPLTDEEVGRLFRAMLKYAADDTFNPKLSGNERITWAAAKKTLKRQWSEYREMCDRNKRIATARYDSTRLDTTPDNKRQIKKNKKQSLSISEINSLDDIKRLVEDMKNDSI